ncbi:unnamed protein product, partial [Tilletia controversa]
MEPMSNFPQGPLQDLLCGHIIPPSNLYAAFLTTAPWTNCLKFKWDARSNTVLLNDLGTVLLSLCAVVPGGSSSLCRRMGSWRPLEPKNTSDVEAVFERYAAVIAGAMTKQIKLRQTPSTSGSAATPTGALMFAVVGAKLSEGI